MGTATIPTKGGDEGRTGSPTTGRLRRPRPDGRRADPAHGPHRPDQPPPHRTLGRELEQSVGIPLVFFDVLIHVGAAPEARLTMSRLSADVALTTGGVTRLVDRMVDAGLVERQNCPSDRRSIHVVLTPEGRAVLDRAVAAHVDGSNAT